MTGAGMAGTGRRRGTLAALALAAALILYLSLIHI